MELDGVDEVRLLRKPLAVYFTHWILELIDSLAALVRRRLSIPATSFIGANRLRTAHWYQR